MRAEIAAFALLAAACAPLDTDGAAPRGSNPSAPGDDPSVPAFDTGFDDDAVQLSPFDGTYEGEFTFLDTNLLTQNPAICGGPITVVVNSRSRIYQMEGEFFCEGDDFTSNPGPNNTFHVLEVSGGVYGRLADPEAGTGTVDLVANITYKPIGQGAFRSPNFGSGGEIGLDFDISSGTLNIEAGRMQAGNGTRLTVTAERADAPSED